MEGLGGLSPSLTLRVWLWSPTASRSYRGLLADSLAVVPGTPRRRPRGRTREDGAATPSGRELGRSGVYPLALV